VVFSDSQENKRSSLIIRDLTEERQSEAKLQDQYNLLRIAGEKVKLGGWSVDLAENRCFWSDEVAAIHEVPAGYSPPVEEGISFYAPEWHNRITKVFTNCAQYGHPYDEEMEIITSSGKRVWVRTIGEAIRDENGKIHKVQGAFQDITLQKKAAEELLKLSRAVEQSPVSIVITDKAGLIEYVNPKTLEITGYEFHEIHGKNPRIFSSGETPKSKYKLLWDTITSGTEWQGEMLNKKKSGELYWELAIISPVKNHEGKITHFIAVKEDLTHKKKAEQALRKAEIAEQTALFKQSFLANMSHEIRTPLTGVLGMVDMLEKTEISESQADYLQTLKSSGENLRGIINEVLDYSKLESGKLILSHQQFHFKSIITDAEMLFLNNTKKNVLIKTEHDPAIPEFVIADKMRLSQILNNLTSNAVKFTYKGTITIRSKLLVHNKNEKKVEIMVEVEDTGIGIPSDLQEKLFTPFGQIDNADNLLLEGTGLGLSICKQLTILMKGKIGVDSEYQKGSRFWFTFPAQIPDEIMVEKSSGSSFMAQLPHIRILYTEDKLINQKVISLQLKALGHEVTIATTGEQALELFEPGKFDLILMDIQMPLLDGIETTKRLKEIFSNLPPVVGISANVFKGAREQYMAQGLDEYLTKPFMKDDFNRVVERFFTS
jgi:PAS domain S-box-containing protein